MIEYDSVTKIYGESAQAVTATDNVTMTIPEGEVVFFLGPSGCGKTTLLRMTNRLESITRGAIRVKGQDIQEMDQVRLRQGMGYVIQQIGLFPNKSIAQNIAIVPKLLGWEDDRIAARVDELLNLVKLDPDIYRNRYPVELSGGQQQRIGVARALAANPDIMLMDEPFGAIDPINREQIQDEFIRLQAKLKKTIVFVSHDLHEAIKMADRVAIFRDGSLVQYDTPEAILTKPRNKFIHDFVGADRALKVLSLIKARDTTNTQPRNVFNSDTPAGDVLHQLEEKKATMGIVLKDSKPLGYVTPKLLKFEEGPVGEIAERFPVFIEDHLPLRNVLANMLMEDMATYPVVNENGDFVGTIGYNCIQQHILQLYKDNLESGE